MNYVNSWIPATQINDPAGSWGWPITTKISLSSAQILDSNSTPITLIPAPWAGKVIAITDMYAYQIYWWVTYATNVTGEIKQWSQVQANVFWNYASTWIRRYWISAAFNSVENTALVLQTAWWNPTAGNWTTDIYITYSILDL